MIRDFSNKLLYNEKYIPALSNNKRYLIMMGGAGSGKSKFQAQKEIIKSYEPGQRIIGIRKYYNWLKDSVYHELTTTIEEWGLLGDFEILKSPLYIKNKLTGSDFLFRGMDDQEKIKSISKPTRIWIEEATELNKKDFDQLDLRLRGKWNLQITCTFNPISDNHWLITDFWDKGNNETTELIHSTFLDNRFVWAEEYKRVMERLKKQDINLYNIYALWIPGKLTDWLIFEKYETIKEIPPEAKLKWYWLDFGYNDPTAMVGVFEYNGKILLEEIIYQSHLNNQDLINLIKTKGIDFNKKIICDNSRPEAIDELHRAWLLTFPCKKGKGSILHWIQLMKQYDLIITNNSTNLKKELDNYCWSKDKDNKIIDKEPVDYLNHLIDWSRYWITEFFERDSEIDIFIW